MAKKKKRQPATVASADEDPFAFLDDVVPPAPSQPQMVAPGDWPEQVPILTEEQFCKGVPQRGDARDLMGWLEVVFDAGAYLTPCRDKAYAALCRLIKDRRKRDMALWEYADDPATTPADMVTLWRDMLNFLEYEL